MTSTSVAPAAQKLLKVAIVGLPNAGKSTLINSIMSLVVCPVSKRVHTTRTIQRAVYLERDTQVVFVDTPGLVNVKEIKKFAFPQDFVFGPEKAMNLADVVAVLHDVSNAVSRNKFDPRIRALLEKFPNKNSVLVLNKIDTIKSKSTLLNTVRILTSGVVNGRPIKLQKTHEIRMREQQIHLQMDNLIERAKRRMQYDGKVHQDLNNEDKLKRMVESAFLEDEIKEGLHTVGWPRFKDVFMISALEHDGIDLLREYFIANAQSNQWMFDEEFLTDVDPKEFTLRVIKSLMLDHLPQEIPYKLTPTIEYWDRVGSGPLRIVINMECPNERYIGRVIGSGGKISSTLCDETESILSNLLKIPVSVSISAWTKEKK